MLDCQPEDREENQICSIQFVVWCSHPCKHEKAEEPTRPRREAPNSASPGSSEKPRMGVVTGPEPESAFLSVHGSLHMTAGSVRKLQCVEYAEDKHTVLLLDSPLTFVVTIYSKCPKIHSRVGRAWFLNYSTQGLLAMLSATVTSQFRFFFQSKV